MSDSEAPPQVDWEAVKAFYLAGAMPVTEIAARHGIKVPALHYRARADAWQRRRAPTSPVSKLKRLVQGRLIELETTIDGRSQAPEAADYERGIRIMDVLTRTLDKVLELERKQRAVHGRGKSKFRATDDARRRELARRLDALCEEPTAAEVVPGAHQPGG